MKNTSVLQISQKRFMVRRAVKSGIIRPEKNERLQSQSNGNRIYKRQQFHVSTENETVSFECPDCHEIFGLSLQFLKRMADIMYRYKCPYCGSERTVNIQKISLI